MADDNAALVGLVALLAAGAMMGGGDDAPPQQMPGHSLPGGPGVPVLPYEGPGVPERPVVWMPQAPDVPQGTFFDPYTQTTIWGESHAPPVAPAGGVLAFPDQDFLQDQPLFIPLEADLPRLSGHDLMVRLKKGDVRELALMEHDILIDSWEAMQFFSDYLAVALLLSYRENYQSNPVIHFFSNNSFSYSFYVENLIAHGINLYARQCIRPTRIFNLPNARLYDCPDPVKHRNDESYPGIATQNPIHLDGNNWAYTPFRHGLSPEMEERVRLGVIHQSLRDYPPLWLFEKAAIRLVSLLYMAKVSTELTSLAINTIKPNLAGSVVGIVGGVLTGGPAGWLAAGAHLVKALGDITVAALQAGAIAEEDEYRRELVQVAAEKLLAMVDVNWLDFYTVRNYLFYKWIFVKTGVEQHGESLAEAVGRRTGVNTIQALYSMDPPGMGTFYLRVNHDIPRQFLKHALFEDSALFVLRTHMIYSKPNPLLHDFPHSLKERHYTIMKLPPAAWKSLKF